MPSEESWNIFQSVLAKQSWSLASVSSDHFFIDLVTDASFFKQESGGYNNGQICQMDGERDQGMRLCVWRKGGPEFFSPLVAHLTCW
jgi:hypothetical protein